VFTISKVFFNIPAQFLQNMDSLTSRESGKSQYSLKRSASDTASSTRMLSTILSAQDSLALSPGV
jgi:hypothetical protein